jgi:branched-chain amino acid transport system substrate-binding protein
VAKYRDKYGDEIIMDAFPLAYDAVMVLADAIRRAGSLDRTKIREALASTTNFQGVTGTITFDQNGEPERKDAVILKFEKGTVIFVKSVTP